MEGSGEFHSQCASSEVRSFVVSFPDPSPPLHNHFWSGWAEKSSGNIAIPFLLSGRRSR